MKLYSHALKFVLLPALSIVAEISVQDAVEGEDFMVIKKSEKFVIHADGVTRTRGEAQISGSFIDKIRGNSGLPSFFYAPSGDYAMPTRVLTETSVPHVDYYPQMVAGTERKPVGNNELIAFVMLNTNEDAYFSIGETSVPVMEGTSIIFPGNVVHHTVIRSGSIKLLGPFDILGMQCVEATLAPSSVPVPVIKSTKAPALKPAKNVLSTPSPTKAPQNAP
jgi:hypothetical protein